MPIETYVDGPYRTFEAVTPADLAGKENYLVEVTSAGKIQLLASGVAIGVLHQRLEGNDEWTVRLLGKGGTVKVKTSGSITNGARVKGASGGTLVDLGGSGRALGTMISPAAGAASGDIVEIIDVIENV